MVRAISVQELAKKVVNQEATTLIDVRSPETFGDWKIEGNKVNLINEPYTKLTEDLTSVTDQVDKDEEIITVCAKGNSSKRAAELLDNAGFTNVYSLEGGMAAWSEHLEPVKVSDLPGNGALYQFVRLGKGCLSYFIESDGEAAVVDAARMTDIYEHFAAEKDVRIKHVIDTHLHADHISGGRKLAEKSGGTYYLPARDAADVTFDYEPLEEGSDITVGGVTVGVQPLYSPGHTIGSTSLIIEDQYLMTGDILFVKSIGRPDLAGQADDWAEDLRNTLYSRYKTLSKEMIVLPAHYSFAEELGEGGEVSAKLGDLYKQNSSLQVEDEEKFRQMVTENLPPQPNAHKHIRETNMGKISPSQEEKKEMEMGPNRCAVEG